MARFLTTDWFDRVNRSSMAVADVTDLVIEQRVSGTPDGDIVYWVEVVNGVLRVGRDAPSSGATVVISTDYKTAVALATGARRAHDAFLQGRIKAAGDVTALRGLTAVVTGMSNALAAVRDDTTY